MTSAYQHDNWRKLTAEWYEHGASEYEKRTLYVDMSGLYEPFLEQLPVGAHILDAGCGSGRDSLYFSKHGYRVTAFDQSEAMVAVATRTIGR